MTRQPVYTLAVLVSSLLVYFWPAATDALVYDRQAILAGEVWRLLSGHTVHFSLSHLLADLLLFGVTGALIERTQPRQVGWLYLSMGGAIGAALFLFDPELARFGGMSGLAYGCIAYLALSGIRYFPFARPYAWGVLAILLLKLVFDSVQPIPVLDLFGPQPFVTVPLSHALGVLVAGICFVQTAPRLFDPHQQDALFPREHPPNP